jgi:ADP-heptose:LPS heptosyltransferase
VNRPEEVQAVTAACLFIERQLFEEVTGITEDYEMYFEDTDLCMKVRQKGKKVFYEPQCVLIHHEGKSSPNQATIDAFNAKAATLFYQRWSDEVVRFDFENLISKNEGKYIHLRQEILPIPEDGSSSATRFETILNHLARLFKSVGPFYAHFGGAGDALLLLSTFYDEEPEQTVVSIANSTEMMKSFFDSFPLLRRVYFIPFPKNYQNHLLLRKIFRILKDFKGMGVTPDPELDYFKEWNGSLDIFEKYKIVRHPRWLDRFRIEKRQPYQVTLAPRGSLRGMVGSKQNKIKPEDWQPLIAFLNERDIHPILLGTPDEAPPYPATGQCIDRRSYCFEEQMKLIASSDPFLGADSWGKTFAALAGVKSIVFHSMRGEDLRGWKDPSDYVFLDPWEEISVVKDLSEFKNTFDFLFRGDKERPTPSLPPIRSFDPPVRSNGHFYIQRNEGLGDVLMALPSARALKHSHPESKVCFITEKRYARLVEANPYVDRVIVAGQRDQNELTPGKFWDLNPAKFGIGEAHEVDAFLKEIGVEIPDSMKEIALKIPKKAHRRVEQLLRKTDAQKRGRKMVLIHPARGDMNRTWPSASWERLSEMFIQKGYGVMVVGNNSSDPRRGVSRVTTKGVIHLVDQLAPLEFVSLCQRADFLVTTDSGPVQLAGGSDIAIAGIYTVVPGRCRLPYRHGKPMWKAFSIEPECECAGCYRYLQDEKYAGPVGAALQNGSLTPIKLFSEWCVNEEKYACLLKHLTPERVFEMSEGLLH